MKKLIVLILALQLIGCGAYGTPLLLASMYDNADPCQTKNRAANYKMPEFCGKGSGTIYYTRDYRTNAIITTTQANVYGIQNSANSNYYQRDSLGRIGTFQ